jgi:deazaflavin-dependent oxidoreductase (nitroreductase family)
LHSTGATSGKPRVSLVSGLHIDDKLLIIGSYAGAEIGPAWVDDLRANRRTRIETGTETVDIEARELSPGERAATWCRIIEIASLFSECQDRTTRTIPVFELNRLRPEQNDDAGGSPKD